MSAKRPTPTPRAMRALRTGGTFPKPVVSPVLEYGFGLQLIYDRSRSSVQRTEASLVGKPSWVSISTVLVRYCSRANSGRPGRRPPKRPPMSCRRQQSRTGQPPALRSSHGSFVGSTAAKDLPGVHGCASTDGGLRDDRTKRKTNVRSVKRSVSVSPDTGPAPARRQLISLDPVIRVLMTRPSRTWATIKPRQAAAGPIQEQLLARTRPLLRPAAIGVHELGPKPSGGCSPQPGPRG